MHEVLAEQLGERYDMTTNAIGVLGPDFARALIAMLTIDSADRTRHKFGLGPTPPGQNTVGGAFKVGGDSICFTRSGYLSSGPRSPRT